MGSKNTFLLFQHSADTWCAAPPGFHDVLRDPVGQGSTRVEAVDALLAHPEFIHRAKLGEWPLEPGLGDFVEVFAPDISAYTGQELLAEISSWSAGNRRRAFKPLPTLHP